MPKISSPWEDLLYRHDAVLQFVRQAPLLLGGTSGSGGGSGGPIGGFTGVLPQTRVAGDSTESFLLTSGSNSSLLSNLNNIRYWLLPAHNFQASTGSPPTDYLTVSSGSWHKTSGEAPLTFPGGNSPPLVAPSSGSRYNLLTINTSGVLSWTHGSDGDPPAMPTFPSPTSGSMPLWLVLGRTSGSVIRFYDDGISHYLFRDVRPFLDWGIGGAGSSGSSPQPGGRVIYTDSNGAPVTDPNFLFDTDSDYFNVTTALAGGVAVAGFATGVGGTGIYGETSTHESYALFGLASTSTSGSALRAEGNYGGSAKLIISGAQPVGTTDHTANVVEIERAIHLGTELGSANITGSLLDLFDNTLRDGGVGGTTSGSLIRGRVDLGEDQTGVPSTVFSVTRAGHIVTSGSVNIQGFAMPVGVTSGYVLTTDANGVGTWQVTGASSGSSPQPGGRVVFTDTNGAAITDSTFLWDNTNKQLQLEATGSNAGIRIGGDVQLYRHALDIWRTADNIIVDRGIDVAIVGTPQTGEVRVLTALKMMTDGVGGGFYAGASSDVQWYRGDADRWDTPDSVRIAGNLGVGTASTYKADIQVASGADRLILRVAVSGVSNGLDIIYTHSTTKLTYTFTDGRIKALGDGTHVFELPADATDPTGGGGAATGRIPVTIGGATRYLAYY